MNAARSPTGPNATTSPPLPYPDHPSRASAGNSRRVSQQSPRRGLAADPQHLLQVHPGTWLEVREPPTDPTRRDLASLCPVAAAQVGQDGEDPDVDVGPFLIIEMGKAKFLADDGETLLDRLRAESKLASDRRVGAAFG